MDYDKGRIVWAVKARIKANFLFRIACFAYCLGLFSLFLSIGMLMAPFDINWFALSFILLSFLFLFLGLAILLWRYFPLNHYYRIKERALYIAKSLSEDDSKARKEIESAIRRKDENGAIAAIIRQFDLANEKLLSIAFPRESVLNRGGYDGNPFIAFALSFLFGMLSLLSVGLLYPVGFIHLAKYQAKHDRIEGKKLIFDGTLREFYPIWLLWYFLTIISFGIFFLFIPKRLLRYQWAHTHFEGELACLGSGFQGNAIVYFLVSVGCKVINIASVDLLRPLTMDWENAYFRDHLYVDGRKLRYDGNAIVFLGKWICWSLLSLATLGIYRIFLSGKLRDYVNSHTRVNGDRELMIWR